MVSSPGINPLTTPAVVTDALLLLALHTPPGVLLLSIIIEPAHTPDGPVMMPGAGKLLIVTVLVADADPQLANTV